MSRLDDKLQGHHISYLLLHTDYLKALWGNKNKLLLGFTVSTGQECGCGLTGQFWLRICHRVVVKRPWGCSHWKARLGLEDRCQGGSLTGRQPGARCWLGGLSFSPLWASLQRCLSVLTTRQLACWLPLRVMDRGRGDRKEGGRYRSHSTASNLDSEVTAQLLTFSIH